MTRTLDCDHPTDNSILEFDDVLKSCCTNVVAWVCLTQRRNENIIFYDNDTESRTVTSDSGFTHPR
jgi:hypothetical protein